MPKIDHNAEILRAVGGFLDAEGAAEFEIVNHVPFLAVTWTVPGAGDARQRAYQERDLDTLRAEARAMRRGVEAPVGSLVELLRTIGQELDREGIELSSISRDALSFRVSGVLQGRHYQAQYRTKDLVAMAAARRASRGRAPQPTSQPKKTVVDSFLGVVLGAPVYTEDGELLGEVIDIRHRYFKVGKSARDEGYWLPAESVAAIGSAGQVVLAPLT